MITRPDSKKLTRSSGRPGALAAMGDKTHPHEEQQTRLIMRIAQSIAKVRCFCCNSAACLHHIFPSQLLHLILSTSVDFSMCLSPSLHVCEFDRIRYSLAFSLSLLYALAHHPHPAFLLCSFPSPLLMISAIFLSLAPFLLF